MGVTAYDYEQMKHFQNDEYSTIYERQNKNEMKKKHNNIRSQFSFTIFLWLT